MNTHTNKKHALIIGASGGIGGAAASYFSEQGFQVIAPVRDLAKQESQTLLKNGAITVYQADPANKEAIDRLIAELHREEVPLSVVVHAAGTFLWDDGFPGPQKTYAEVEEMLRWANLSTKENVIASLLEVYGTDCSRMTHYMVSSHAATFAPDHPFRNGPFKEEAYVKIMGLVSQLGLDLKTKGFFKDVVVFEPGLIRTEMAKKAFPKERAGDINWDTVETPDEYVKKIFS